MLFFVDNLTALGALQKGRSKLSPPLNRLVFAWWQHVHLKGIADFSLGPV